MIRYVYSTDGDWVPVADLIAGVVDVIGPLPVFPDLVVNSRGALNAALSDVSNSGKTIAVTADISGSPITISTVFTEQVRVVAQPNDMTIHMVPIAFSACSHVTIEGFNFSEGGMYQIASWGPSHYIHIKHNWVHDFVGNTLFMPGGLTNLGFVFSGNLVENMRFDNTAVFPTGYGVYNDSTLPGAIFTYNTFNGGGQSADGMQLGALHDVLIANNEFVNITFDGIGPDPHADALMIWGGSSNVMIKDNRFKNISALLLGPDTDYLTMENNLIYDAKGRAIDSAINGTSGAVNPLGWVFRKNTILVSTFESIVMNGPIGNRGGCTADRNLVKNLNFNPDPWDDQDNHNLLTGTEKTAWPGATNQFNFVPSFYDDIDYLPNNLPPGYEDVGYRRVPAGYANYVDPDR